MLWEPPTEQEKRIVREFSDVFRDIVKADAEGLLYVCDIRVKLAAATLELAGSNLSVMAHLLENYGIKLSVAEDGINLVPTYEISDEQKYLIFMMKF